METGPHCPGPACALLSAIKVAANVAGRGSLGQAPGGSSAVLLGSSSVSPVAGSLLWFLGTAVTPRGGTWRAPGPLWFDYPDDDRAKILATYRYIGEKPVFFAANPLPRVLHHILLGSVLLTLLFLLYQICSTMVCRMQS
ncbi:fertilization-influencing membrane protein [Lepidochelys kempii]|uniref:fertilization-influencing membrane protein n=1 Tax=Lepidochelys kempii TaxID=8472 RepID=UPI003C703E14